MQAKAASNVPGHTKIFAQSLLAEAEYDDKIAALLSFGTRLAEVRKAAEALQSRGLTPTVADARFAKPLDRDLIVHLARSHAALITIEEGSIGGFGSHAALLLAEEAIFDTDLKYRSLVLPDIFIDQATPKAMYRVASARIAAKVLETLGVAVAGKRAQGWPPVQCAEARFAGSRLSNCHAPGSWHLQSWGR